MKTVENLRSKRRLFTNLKFQVDIASRSGEESALRRRCRSSDWAAVGIGAAAPTGTAGRRVSGRTRTIQPRKERERESDEVHATLEVRILPRCKCN